MTVGFAAFSLKLEKMVDSQSLRVQCMFSGTTFQEYLTCNLNVYIQCDTHGFTEMVLFSSR